MFFFIMGERIQSVLKVGHYRPASETPLKWRFAGGPMMAQIESWLCSIVIPKGIWTSIA